jgi:hypothetical protein
VAIVIVVVAAPLPLGVTVPGEKLQVEFAGSPEQANVTCPVNPPTGASDTVVLPVEPCSTVKLVGETLSVKLGAATTIVTALEVDVAKYVSPPYCAVIVSLPVGNLVVASVAVPVASNVPIPRLVVPERKVTEPEGSVPVFDGPATLAVRVTLWPGVAVVVEAVRAVVVVSGAIFVTTIVVVSAVVFGASTFPAASVAME